jgi:hypothetical protein
MSPVTRVRQVTVTAVLHNKQGKAVARAAAAFTVVQRHHWWQVFSL